MGLTDTQLKRYRRHVMLDEVGIQGQQKLLESRVLVIGTGGLGSPAIMYLAAAGVGTIGLADDDVVELSNLQRQIIHDTANIDMDKIVSAKLRVEAINPDVKVVSHRCRVNEDNIAEIVGGYDFVIDATDNFESKFLINDRCVEAGVPFSHAGVSEFVGQTMTVLPGSSACYRCVFGDCPDPMEVLPASNFGILGVTPAVIGPMQATEAIKSILSIGAPLTDCLLTYDALKMEFRKVPVKKNQQCTICG